MQLHAGSGNEPAGRLTPSEPVLSVIPSRTQEKKRKPESSQSHRYDNTGLIYNCRPNNPQFSLFLALSVLEDFIMRKIPVFLVSALLLSNSCIAEKDSGTRDKEGAIRWLDGYMKALSGCTFTHEEKKDSCNVRRSLKIASNPKILPSGMSVLEAVLKIVDSCAVSPNSAKATFTPRLTRYSDVAGPFNFKGSILAVFAFEDGDIGSEEEVEFLPGGLLRVNPYSYHLFVFKPSSPNPCNSW